MTLIAQVKWASRFLSIWMLLRNYLADNRILGLLVLVWRFLSLTCVKRYFIDAFALLSSLKPARKESQNGAYSGH